MQGPLRSSATVSDGCAAWSSAFPIDTFSASKSLHSASDGAVNKLGVLSTAGGAKTSETADSRESTLRGSGAGSKESGSAVLKKLPRSDDVIFIDDDEDVSMQKRCTKATNGDLPALIYQQDPTNTAVSRAAFLRDETMDSGMALTTHSSICMNGDPTEISQYEDQNQKADQNQEACYKDRQIDWRPSALEREACEATPFSAASSVPRRNSSSANKQSLPLLLPRHHQQESKPIAAAASVEALRVNTVHDRVAKASVLAEAAVSSSLGAEHYLRAGMGQAFPGSGSPCSAAGMSKASATPSNTTALADSASEPFCLDSAQSALEVDSTSASNGLPSALTTSSVKSVVKLDATAEGEKALAVARFAGNSLVESAARAFEKPAATESCGSCLARPPVADIQSYSVEETSLFLEATLNSFDATPARLNSVDGEGHSKILHIVHAALPRNRNQGSDLAGSWMHTGPLLLFLEGKTTLRSRVPGRQDASYE